MSRNQYRSRHQPAPQKSFAKLCLIYGGVLAGVAVAGDGAFVGIEALRANSWEKELQTAQSLYQGASAVQARELSIAQKREDAGKNALAQLEIRQEALEVLLGQSYPALKDSLADTAAKTQSRIVSGGRIEKSVENLIALRAKGLGDGPFIDQAKELSQAAWPDGIEQRERQTAHFNGAPGFESEELGRLSRRLADFVGQSDERLATLRRNVAEQAASFDMGRAEKTQSEWLSVAQKEIQQESQQQLDSQINGYVNQVKVAADAAFRNEGEDMDSSDWDEIRTDFQNDPDWIAARDGLANSAQASAQSAVGIASDAMTAERESAVDLASQIAQDKSRADDLSIWQMALLMRWMSPSQSSLYIAADPWYFASNGYSLTGQPSYEWGGRQAFRSSQGNPVAAQGWRYPSGQQSRAQNRPASASPAAQAARSAFTASSNAPSPVSSARSAGSMPNAVGQPRPSSINSNAMTAANMAQALGASPANAKASPGAYSPKAAGPATVAPAGVGSPAAAYGATGLGSKMDASAINRMASMSSLMAAGNASKQAATSAAGAAAQTAAGRAAGTAAQSATNLAAQSAAQKAAATSAQRAATGAADTAAKNAATVAASNAANRAAGSAAQRAATTAAGKAADKAADSAAQRAASNAAQRAASSAASRAAQVAANRAAQSAASKAAQSASSKASQAASSKASQSASSRSSSSSSRR